MTFQTTDPSKPELVFTKEEWDACLKPLTEKMTEHLKQFRTPVFKNLETHGEGWGSGSFIEHSGQKYILTNQHVAAVRNENEQLGYMLRNQETLVKIKGNHVEMAWPWDLSLLPVNESAWSKTKHASRAIQVDQIALAHTPVSSEVFAFSGFSGNRTSFHFDVLFFEATTSIARQVDLPEVDKRWDTRFHFGLDYRPDVATQVLGNQGLPNPPGLSGSTVWNTCFVEAKMRGISWTPDLARVTGVVWGWPSSKGFLVATRAEHVRSFLLGVPGSSP